MTVNHYYSRRQFSKLRLGVIKCYIRGYPFEFLTASGVFSKRRLDPGTRLLCESMILPEDGVALDLGCGYGVIGIAAAVFNPNLKVYLTDSNERAVWLARLNAKRIGVHNVTVKTGFLYRPVENIVFDTILSNPPITAGMKTVLPIITEAPNHLEERGTLQLVVRSKIGAQRIQSVMKATFGNVKVVARGGGFRVLLSNLAKTI